MKILKYFTAVLLASLVLSCEDEKLEGTFYNDDGEMLEEAMFEATVEDFHFVGSFANAETVQGITTIQGVRFNGDVIVLTIHGTSEGTYSLVTQGEGTFGIDVAPGAFSTNTEGGLGVVNISLYDTDAGLISGTFSFIARRALVDGDGNPILDGNGNPVYDSVTVTEGKFVNIELVSDGSTYEEFPVERRLKNITSAGVDNFSTEYFYNEDGTLQLVYNQTELGLYETFIGYAGGTIDSVFHYFNGTYSKRYDIYSGSGGLVNTKISYEITQEEDTLAVQRSEYFYNSSQKVGEIRVFENDTIEDYFLRYHLSYDGLGNVSSFKQDWATGNDEDVIYEYSYDDKNHYYRTINPMILFILDSPSVRSNPVLKEEYLYPFTAVENQWDYEIEYDEYDYPIQILEYLNGVLQNTVTITYFE